MDFAENGPKIGRTTKDFRKRSGFYLGCRRDDKVLQRKIMAGKERYPDKWVPSEDSYRVLCPDDPGRIGTRQKHRAMDDAVREGWILNALRG